MCSGDEKIYKWVLAWFANMFQEPTNKPGTSLALRGEQGVGKTKVGEVFGSLMEGHYQQVSDPRYVTGRFNSHLVSCLLLHCDEAFWAGDKKGEGQLKDLVTGHDHLIEFKLKEPIKVRNYVRLFATGNRDWLIPAGFHERRFAVLDVGKAHMQDSDYFAAIDREMDNGGREALLHYMLNLDISKVKLREVPKTAALLEQKFSSLDSKQAWWLDMLMSGELPPEAIGCVHWCLATDVVQDYIAHAQKQGERRRAIETQLGIFLTKYAPGVTKERKRWTTQSSDGRPHSQPQTINHDESVYTFPALAECRSNFARQLGQEVAWPEKAEWTHKQSEGIM